MPATDVLSSNPVSYFFIPNSVPLVTRSLLGDSKWGTGGLGTRAEVYFSFAKTNANWFWEPHYTENASSEIYNDFRPFTTDQKAAARTALEKWANVANLDFIEVANEQVSAVGDIRFASSGALIGVSLAHAYLPNPLFAASGDIWFSTNPPLASNRDFNPGANGFRTMMHEIGHALGLEHPHEGNTILSSNLDHYQYTIMSYRTAAGIFNDGLADYYPTSPMVIDILGMQELYGANNSYNREDNIYSYDDSTYSYETIWDAGGNDTIAYNGRLDAKIDLNQGSYSSLGPAFSRYSTDTSSNGTPSSSANNNGRGIYVGTVRGDRLTPSSDSIISDGYENNITETGGASNDLNNVGIAYNVTIENAIGGSGNDAIYGNQFNNVIDGGEGTDTFFSSLYRDEIISIEETATGNYTITSKQDVDILKSIEYIQFADETIELSRDISQSARPNYDITINGVSTRAAAENYTGPVAYLQYQQLGSEDNEVVIGAATNDFINLLGGDDAADGGAGNDVLDGGTGSNFLQGGQGTDVFFIDGRGGQTTWSTITDFNGDSINIWGWNDGISKVLIQKESDGASGYQGATLHMDLNADDIIDTSLTFSGLALNQISNSQSLSVQDNGYLLII